MMSIERWNKSVAVKQSDIETELKKDGLEPFIWQDGTGTFYPTHSHPYTEIRWVLKGSLTFGVDGEEITLYPGDRLELVEGTPHYAKTSDDSTTVYLCATKKV